MYHAHTQILEKLKSHKNPLGHLKYLKSDTDLGGNYIL